MEVHTYYVSSSKMSRGSEVSPLGVASTLRLPRREGPVLPVELVDGWRIETSRQDVCGSCHDPEKSGEVPTHSSPVTE